MAWAPAYATDRQLASYLRIGDTVDDPELGLAVESASRAIDHATNRQFGVVDSAEARTYEVRWSRTKGLWVADIDDLMTTTGLVVTVSGSAVASSNYQLYPLNAAAESMPWTRLGLESATPTSLGAGPATIEATAQWGWSTVPDTIHNATLIQAARFHARQRSPLGVAGSPEMGSELRLLAKADPDVEVMVRRFRRHHPMVVV